MKIKQIPEDFIVEEVSSIELKASGAFKIFLLEKRGLDTFGAKKIIGHEFKISLAEIGVAGLKDKHALTRQYISIPSRVRIPDEWSQKSIRLTFKGFSDQPILIGQMKSNRFTVVIRDIRESETEHLKSRSEQVFRDGVPNYFDSQRFGSVRGADSFIAKHLIAGDFESALRVLLTSFSRNDSAQVRNCRKKINSSWGDWDACLSFCKEAPRARREKKILSYLKESSLKDINPKENNLEFTKKNNPDFKGAFMLIERELQKMFLAAYQSFLWNETLKVIISRYKPGLRLKQSSYEAGFFFFPLDPPSDFTNSIKGLNIPLLNPKAVFQDEAVGFACEKVCKDQGISIEGLKISGLDLSFKDGLRQAWVFPRLVLEPSVAKDELNSGSNSKKFKITLSFELLPGAYATIILKVIGVEKKRRR